VFTVVRGMRAVTVINMWIEPAISMKVHADAAAYPRGPERASAYRACGYRACQVICQKES
jgi:hypothetical protein